MSLQKSYSSTPPTRKIFPNILTPLFRASFPSPGFQGAPIEVVRGCNHARVFCAEPHSIGRKISYRELSVVMKDIEILARHNITKLYLISSELNPEGNEFILQLADRMVWV